MSSPAVPSKNGQSTPSAKETGLYENPDDALKKVSSEFEYWSGKVSEYSLQMCYALIGANWVVFGSVNGILRSPWSKASMLAVLVALFVNVLGTLVMSESHRSRVAYGEADPVRWQKEYRENMHSSNAWTFTKSIEVVGASMRWIKSVLTLIGGFCLIVGAILA